MTESAAVMCSCGHTVASHYPEGCFACAGPPCDPRCSSSGPPLDQMIHLIATSERAVSAEVIIDGKRYTIRKWRDGTIALRPRG